MHKADLEEFWSGRLQQGQAGGVDGGVGTVISLEVWKEGLASALPGLESVPYVMYVSCGGGGGTSISLSLSLALSLSLPLSLFN